MTMRLSSGKKCVAMACLVSWSSPTTSAATKKNTNDMSLTVLRGCRPDLIRVHQRFKPAPREQRDVRGHERQHARRDEGYDAGEEHGPKGERAAAEVRPRADVGERGKFFVQETGEAQERIGDEDETHADHDRAGDDLDGVQISSEAFENGQHVVER